ncbi:MAG: glycosyltransferase family 2 protein [Phycisphaerales bacterium]|nr:MAG: glycosyltransferase family 2 protein [Phycisphaerales bacterium]
MVDLSIVVVNYNNFRVLRACLASLNEAISDLNCEVIISDNGSIDGSVEWIRQEYPAFRILENGANLGFAEANNRAFQVAQGEFIILLNPDTVLEKEPFKTMMKVLRENPSAGAVGCKLLDPDGSRQMSARAFPTLTTYFLGLTGLAYHYPHDGLCGRFDMTYWDGESTRSVDWVSGAALMIRREVLDDVEGLDPYFFLTYDEVDFCHRITDAGYEIWYTHQAAITHLDRQSEPQLNPKPEARIKYLTVERNSRVRYFVKHHGYVYASLVEALHLFLAGGLLLKISLLGTKQSPIVVMEKKLLWQLYWRTACRLPKVCWGLVKSCVLGKSDQPQIPLFVNPYLADEH